ncbi:MAG: sigma-54-dependent Fis family transcriptional regulator [Spirochaetales bacterium]|nr:sigma-54-dependent Fis family transcriptional regulator [Spirochaetales bacterium]
MQDEPEILVVDDEPYVAESLASVLTSANLQNVAVCTDPARALELAGELMIKVLLLDLNMPGIPGRKLLEIVKGDHPNITVIVVTASNELSTAVECMRLGAFDYLVKPVEPSRLVGAVKRAIELSSIHRTYAELKTRMLTRRLANPEAFSSMITGDERLYAVFMYLESVAGSREPLLIAGETGVGKNLLAEAVHRASQRTGEFVSINIAGMDEQMVSDTLMGHRKGAFTGALENREGLLQKAKGGTMFVDEIGDLTISSQIKLLRILDTGDYYPLGSDIARRTDTRFVFATNRDLKALIDQEKFRKDLYYRLSTYEVEVPPLRERKGDILLLVDSFLDEASRDLKKTKPAVSDAACGLLESYDYPGNVRELRSLIFNAMSGGQRRNVLHPEAFGRITRKPASGDTHPGQRNSGEAVQLVFGERLPTLAQAAELLIAEALRRSGGNRTAAAGMLGITHQALSKRLQRKAPEE